MQSTAIIMMELKRSTNHVNSRSTRPEQVAKLLIQFNHQLGLKMLHHMHTTTIENAEKMSDTLFMADNVDNRDDRFEYISYVYFHGKLESVLGTDLALLNGKLMNGIHSCYTIHDGEAVECTMFIWDGMSCITGQMGLVVYAHDLEAVSHAAHKYCERT
jgi:hypothetical protein